MANLLNNNQLLLTLPQDNPGSKKRKWDAQVSKNLNALSSMESQKLILHDVASKKATINQRVPSEVQRNAEKALSYPGIILIIIFQTISFPSYPLT